jgi:hypothetical protein
LVWAYNVIEFLSGSATDPIYAPAKITDLKVIAYDAVTKIVTLQWTATGNELDQGQGT